MRHTLSAWLLVIGVVSPLAGLRASAAPSAWSQRLAVLRSVGRGLRTLAGFPKCHPETALHPGDLIVYFDPDAQKELLEPGGGMDPMLPYYAAIGGYGHAAIVARDRYGALFHLDSESSSSGPDFRGALPYFVVRPPPPAGLSREAFESRVSQIASTFREVGYGYDPSMSPSFRDPATVSLLRDLCDGKSSVKAAKEQHLIPPQYCSGLTQTVLAVAGAPLASGTSLEAMLDTAIARMRIDAGGDEPTDADVEIVVKSTVEYFVEDPLQRYVLEQPLKQALRNKLRHKEQPSLIDSKLKTPVVRPVDLLWAGFEGVNGYRTVGYFPGDSNCPSPRERPHATPRGIAH